MPIFALVKNAKRGILPLNIPDLSGYKVYRKKAQNIRIKDEIKFPNTKENMNQQFYKLHLQIVSTWARLGLCIENNSLYVTTGCS